MKKVLLALLFIAAITTTLIACRPTGPQIQISNAWGRPSPMVAGNGAAYMLIENMGGESDRLINASSEISEAVEIHDMTMEDDVMKMFQIDGLDIPARGSVELKPGGKHIMFISIYNKLEIGQVITIVLEFEKSGEIIVEAEIHEP